ncbi:reverse transcriptase domain-containing protein [Rhizobium leguminosarum]|uniref:reverse transcriptase domain-containing protein n=1 Tax=Rhizobium leguminosarum TaxID=384 RepID=UPI003F9C1118
MPPRSYYNAPRSDDYLAFAECFFPNELQLAKEFTEKTGLPYLRTTVHLAAYLGISASTVRQILHRPSYHYRTFEIKKKSGGIRRISTPRTYLKVIQWWIADNILAKAQLNDCVYGFRSGRSYVDNAAKHIGRKHILNVDIKSFFESIDQISIANVFSHLGYNQESSMVLAALTSLGGFAPTGAPTSPMIANIVLRDVDSQLEAFCAGRGLVYTRYADDLTFSRDEWIGDDVLVEIDKIVIKQGFALNPNKTKFMGAGDRQEVTGLLVNASLNSTKKWRNGARGFLHTVISDPVKLKTAAHKVAGIYGTLLQVDAEKQKKITKLAEYAMHLLKNLENNVQG